MTSRLAPEQRRPLEPLASSRHGGSEELLGLGHGFSCRLLAGRERDGLAAEGGCAALRALLPGFYR
jgi:hypothetical protein